jgi:hypothetical protein
VNLLNKQSSVVDKGLSSSLEIGRGYSSSESKTGTCCQMLYLASDCAVSFAQNRLQRLAVVNTAMNIRIP